MRKIIAILLVLCCFWQAFAHNRAGNPARYAPGQLLVKFREGVLLLPTRRGCAIWLGRRYSM
jgi:hypothetical protein